MYQGMCPMIGMMPACNYYMRGQMPMYYYPMTYQETPGKKKCKQEDEEDEVKIHEPAKKETKTEEMYRSGYRCMRIEDEDDRNPGMGTQVPQGEPMGHGNSGFFQPGMPGQMMPGSTMQGTSGMPTQQTMNPQHFLQMIEQNNPEIIRMMTSLNIPIVTARQIILSIIQAAQTNMQLRSE